MCEHEFWQLPTKGEAEKHCPECRQPLGFYDQIYILRLNGEVAGCSDCIKAQGALEWISETKNFL